MIDLFNRVSRSIPRLDHKLLRRGILVIILICLFAYLPKMLKRIEMVDQQASRTVYGGWDDWNYQVLAINLLMGHGFADNYFQPWYSYHLSKPVPAVTDNENYSFYRAPGFPLLLSAVYAFFGDQTLIARQMLAILTWSTALLLILIGYGLAGWLGVIAGGLTSLHYLNFGGGITGVEGIYAGRLISEPVATFWLVLFFFLFMLYQKNKSNIYLYAASVSLVGAIFTRAYFLIAIPMFFVYLYHNQCNRKDLFLFGAITIIPIIAWSSYASITRQEPVLFTTQGQLDFPRFNNIDVITGFGPDRMNQGGWQPGFAYLENGDLTITNYNAAQSGENGWIKGFNFWLENPKKLPVLLYVKLRAGMWYQEGSIYLIGIGLLLLAIGFRSPSRMSLSHENIPTQWILFFQLVLIFILLITGGNLPFYIIALIIAIIALVGILLPYGNVYQPHFYTPDWFLIFLIAYILITLIFGGNPRFHYPLDPIIMLIGLVGLLIILYEIIKGKIQKVALRRFNSQATL